MKRRIISKVRSVTRCLVYSLSAVFVMPVGAEVVSLEALERPAGVVRDSDGIAHVWARNEHDLFVVQGWVHAQDRLFQMDLSRHLASGTAAELLGEEALASDVQLRTMGLRRAAERSWAQMQYAAQKGDPLSIRAIAGLEAYTSGVNAYLNCHAQLPPQYRALKLATVEPWGPVDSLVISKGVIFSLSFSLSDIENTRALQTYQTVLGADAGHALFFDDLFRIEPFNAAATVPDSGGSAVPSALMCPLRHSPQQGAALSPQAKTAPLDTVLNSETVTLLHRYVQKIEDLPVLQRALRPEYTEKGSNQWAISAALSESGNPLLANDPHLSLGYPTTFYPMHLRAPGYHVMGNGFVGAPFMAAGQNDTLFWGPTVNPMDVTDVFVETVVFDENSPSGFSVVMPNDARGFIEAIPETYRVNRAGTLEVLPPEKLALLGINPVSLTVPDRYDGVVIEFQAPTETQNGRALTIQYTGFGPTRELEAFYALNTARQMADFRQGLNRMDAGALNWAYGDRHGNIAYFTSGILPIRTDLETQAGPAQGIPPYFVRTGSNPEHQWLTRMNTYPDQIVPYEILSPEEMPQLVNPKNGYFVNANNDPLGLTNDNDPLNEWRDTGGVLYFSAGFASGFRAGRITELLNDALMTGTGKISVSQMAEIQADVGLLDAQFFVPHLQAAYRAAQEPDADTALIEAASDPRLAEVISGFAVWADTGYLAKTGIPEGYDAEDTAGAPETSLNDDEVAASVATTLYSVWRSSVMALTIDATLDGISVDLPRPGDVQRMTALKKLIERGGNAVSGIDFFVADGANQFVDVQIVLLSALSDALNRLASDEFARAFGGSTDLNDYRWGKLHRIEFTSPLGQSFSVPDANGLWPAPLAGLKGIPTDGGFGSVDASAHPVTAKGNDGFMFSHGPTNRWVTEMRWYGPVSQSIWPGGTRAIPGDPFYLQPQLPLWLTNEARPIRFYWGEIFDDLSETTLLLPK